MRHPWLVRPGSSLAKTCLRIGLPIEGLVKKTIFSQFCGGETIEDSDPTIATLAEQGVGSILDYSAEGKERETVFDATTEELLQTVERAGQEERIPFSVFKVTGIGRYELLEKVSTGATLSEEEEAEYQRIRERVVRICEKAYERNVRIFIDAEESWYQDAIDDMTREMMRAYNQDKARIFTTVQLYRTDRLDFLDQEMKKAKEEGFCFAVKLVRGAYMEKERKQAAEKNIPDPIQPDKTKTDEAFDRAIDRCLEGLDDIAFCAGTHNEASCAYLAERMEKMGLEKDDPRIHFSQLLGMGDHISFVLAANGYNVSKYVPYGPVRDVLPYLTRRAQENTSVQGQSNRELHLIEQEMDRRKAERKAS
ncbi:MAG: proline dehydrogenase family protein [Flavobacteriales bacterium]